MKTGTCITILISLLVAGCNRPDEKPAKKVVIKKIVERKKPAVAVSYHKENGRKWLKQQTSASVKQLIATINRTDIQHLENIDSIIIPNDFSADIAYYLPFPFEVPALQDVSKIIFFSYPTQSFGAYENGTLVYTGATNMGRKNDQTPTGIYYTNWKAAETTSTFNDEWTLKWNFNIENKLGIGWHEYEMPGYPSSHSCLRLQEKDARYLYTWADQWILNRDTVQVKGTPVVVFGYYDFKAPKPWLSLTGNTHRLDIAVSEIEKLVAAALPLILNEQEKRLAQAAP
ncbi:MAG: L,D-transpeptidase [Ferruginibacter sp.]